MQNALINRVKDFVFVIHLKQRIGVILSNLIIFVTLGQLIFFFSLNKLVHVVSLFYQQQLQQQKRLDLSKTVRACASI